MKYLFSDHDMIVIVPPNLCISHEVKVNQLGLKWHQGYGLQTQEAIYH